MKSSVLIIVLLCTIAAAVNGKPANKQCKKTSDCAELEGTICRKFQSKGQNKFCLTPKGKQPPAKQVDKVSPNPPYIPAAAKCDKSADCKGELSRCAWKNKNKKYKVCKQPKKPTEEPKEPEVKPEKPEEKPEKPEEEKFTQCKKKTDCAELKGTICRKFQSKGQKKFCLTPKGNAPSKPEKKPEEKFTQCKKKSDCAELKGTICRKFQSKGQKKFCLSKDKAPAKPAKKEPTLAPTPAPTPEPTQKPAKTQPLKCKSQKDCENNGQATKCTPKKNAKGKNTKKSFCRVPKV
jgi:DUF2075 family protein